MEIVFKSPTSPQNLLNLDEILAQWPWDTLWALLCAIRDATFAPYFEHRSLLLGSLKALQIQESLFHSVLTDFTADWIPTRREEQIIQTAYHGFYPVDDIEGPFFQSGGLHGIVALAIAFRHSDSIRTQWKAIDDAPAQQWLVRNVAQLFSRQENNWISNFTPYEPHEPYPLRYLGTHANRRQADRRSSVVSQARSLLHQSSSRGEPYPYFPRKDGQLQERHDGEHPGRTMPMAMAQSKSIISSGSGSTTFVNHEIETLSPTNTLSPPEESSNLQVSQIATTDKQYENTRSPEDVQQHQRPQSCQSHHQPTSKSIVSRPSHPQQPPTMHAKPDFVRPAKRRHSSLEPSFSDDLLCTPSFPSNNESSFNKQDQIQHSEIRHHNQETVGNRSPHTSNDTLAPIFLDRFIAYPQQRHATDKTMIASLTPQARSPLFHQPLSRGEDVPPCFPRKYRQPQVRHERASYQQPPTPTSIPSPPDERLDNKRPKWDQRSFRFRQDLPPPISITSPPVQGLPEHQQLQERHHNRRASSPTQQCIPTPTSHASPSGQDLNLFSHVLDVVDPGLKERKQYRWPPTPISLERLKTHDTHARIEAAEATPSNGLGVMLNRAISPQPRWSGQGVPYEVTPDDAGLHRTTEISGGQPPEQLQVALAHQEEALLVLEKVFHHTKLYFENTCRNMTFDDHGTLLTQNGATYDLCNDFDSYCFTATMLRRKALVIEFRCALSKAFALVEPILRDEHPRTLPCFLEVLIYFIQTELLDITALLRDFIKEMSTKVIREGHPWGQICRLLGELESGSLDQAMAQLWKCITETFDSILGKTSRLAVSVRLDYIKRVFGATNLAEEERLLRDILTQFKRSPDPTPPRVRLNLAHNLNRQRRYSEAERMALAVFSLLQECKIVERIECKKIISHSQFYQGKALAAERTMRVAIGMVVKQWGRQHSWVPEFMNVLEGWLRDWGREEDANKLRREIEELIRKGESDEQPDAVQGLLVETTSEEA